MQWVIGFGVMKGYPTVILTKRFYEWKFIHMFEEKYNQGLHQAPPGCLE